MRVMSPIAVLDSQIKAAGIPIDGVSLGPPIRVDFKPEATQPQKDQAAVIVAAFNGKGRQSRSLASIRTDLRALSAADKAMILDSMIAEFLIDRPDFASKLGVALSGDESEP